MITALDDNGLPDKSPDSRKVVRRALTMCALTCRGSLESGAGHPEAQSVWNSMLRWVTETGIWDEVEAGEERILRAPLGELTTQEMVRATWYSEGLAVLAWAINRLDRFPKHDEKVDPYSVTDSLLFLKYEAVRLIDEVKLRSPTELDACREFLYAIHCRIRDFLRNGSRIDFSAWVDMKWLSTLGLHPADLIVDHDLAIGGNPITEVEHNRLQECEWVTSERHRAIIWLVNQHRSYSEVRVDT